jgi:hypothetical protein
MPTLCVELERGCTRAWATIAAELRELAARHDRERGELELARITHYLHYDDSRGFPVDIRHNAKIGREKLCAWAQARLS